MTNENRVTGLKDESTMRPFGKLSIVWVPQKPALARTVHVSLLAQPVSAISKENFPEKAFDPVSLLGLKDFEISDLPDATLEDPMESIQLDASSGSSTDSTLVDDPSEYSTDSTLVSDSSEDSDSTDDSSLSEMSDSAKSFSLNEPEKDAEQEWDEDDGGYYSQQQYDHLAYDTQWEEDFIAECTEEEGFEDWPTTTYEPNIPEVPEEHPTWTSALPNPTVLNRANTIEANGKVLEFLSLFLFDKRSGGISFKYRHGLANLMLDSVSASCFDTVDRVAREELTLLQIRHHDQLELRWWLVLLRSLHSEDKVSFSAFLPNDYFVEKIRHKAIHRLDYDTSVIRTVVRFLIALNDSDRLIHLEKVLRILYGTLSGAFSVSDEETCFLNSALQLYPTEYRTVYQVLYAVQGILENLAFERLQQHWPEDISKYHMSAAEELELHSPEDDSWSEVLNWFDLTKQLRNAVAHRDDLTSSDDMIGWNTAQKILEMSEELALSLGEDNAAAEIGYVAREALEELQTASMAQQQELGEYSADELDLMSKMTAERKCKWMFAGDSEDYHGIFSSRCGNVSRFYERMANAKRRNECCQNIQNP